MKQRSNIVKYENQYGNHYRHTQSSFTDDGS